MDTRVATAELGWTAYPNSGVSLFWPKYEKKGGGEEQNVSKVT